MRLKILLTVLITGCGGAAGQGIVKALQIESNDLRLIGADADPYAGFFHLKDSGLSKGYCLPHADRPNYISEVIKLCRKENVDIIFPGSDSELTKIATHREDLEQLGTKVIVSTIESVMTCRDKWLTYSRLRKAVPVVRSALAEEGVGKALSFTGLPAVVKPRIGWGSKQVYKVQNTSQAKIILKEVNNPIIQTWLDGEEYTVDCFADKTGKPVCIVPRRRIKIFHGLSFEGVTVRDPQLVNLGIKIAAELPIYGPFNFQAKTVDGKPLIFEINPRFSGSGILTVHAGANIPFLAVQEACGMKIPNYVEFEEGVVFSRFFDEVFFQIPKGSECPD
jgi:carbamoyl-phosphate synthase large subunit